jgi:hypothetical protein
MNFRASVTIKFSDMDSYVEQNIVPHLVQAQKDATNAVLVEAQAIVPIDTGDLHDSGRTDVEWLASIRHVDGYISFTAPYAMFVEYGTGIRGAGTYPYDLPDSGVPITGSWIYDYKNQNWIGHTAQPYLRPALDTAMPAILAAFQSQGFLV